MLRFGFISSKLFFLEAINKTSFPLIAIVNSQARCENFHPITIFESTRCELAFAMSGKEALAQPLYNRKLVSGKPMRFDKFNYRKLPIAGIEP